MARTSSIFYKIARFFGKIASGMNDIETIASGDPKRIGKRAVRKTAYKSTNKLLRKLLK